MRARIPPPLRLGFSDWVELANRRNDEYERQQEEALNEGGANASVINAERWNRGFQRAGAERNLPWMAWLEAAAQGQDEMPVFGYEEGQGLDKLRTTADLPQAANKGWGSWQSLEAPNKSLEGPNRSLEGLRKAAKPRKPKSQFDAATEAYRAAGGKTEYI